MRLMIAALSPLLALQAPCQELPTKHQVTPKDTMWDLAGRYYDDPFKWRRIAEANPPPEVNDPHWIYPNQVLVIPGLEDPPPATHLPMAGGDARPPDSTAPPEPPPAVDHDRAAGLEAAPSDGLSERFPKGLTGGLPAMPRFKAPAGWREDGSVEETDEMEAAAAEGDSVQVRLRAEAGQGERLHVYRRAAPTEDDADKKAVYLSKVGVLEVRRKAGRVYRAVILKSDDTVQVGDLVVRERR